MPKERRLSLRVSEATDRRVRYAQKMSGSENMTETFRRSMSLYVMLLDARDSGKRILLEDEDGTTQEIIPEQIVP